MKKSPDGIDPVDIYMNGTLNVVTGFALGINYKFDDPDFKILIHCVKVYTMRSLYKSNGLKYPCLCGTILSGLEFRAGTQLVVYSQMES